MRITVPSFPKINWSLEILGRRRDGFHELLTLLQTIDFSDEISFELPCNEITLTTEGLEVASGADNLIHAAAHLLKVRTGFDGGVCINLKKRIPVGAGLGGGSSNVAITLLVLNQLWECGLKEQDLFQLAAKLGSDVPFFLTGGTALGRGRGEQILPVSDLPREFSILIYYPRFQVTAEEAYSGLKHLPDKLTRSDPNTTIRRFHQVLEEGNWSDLRNDLEGPVFSDYPLLAQKKQELFAAGCEFAMLSGSGSALFGVSAASSLEAAMVELSGSGDADIILCKTLSRVKYSNSLKKAGIHTDLFSI